MKAIFYILLLVSFFSCTEKSTSVFIIANQTYHSVSLTFYALPRTEHTISIGHKNTDNTLTFSGAGSTLITQQYDSVLVTYDDTVRITHISKFGETPIYMENHILDDNSWIYLQTTDLKRKHKRRDYTYIITEEDYLNAL